MSRLIALYHTLCNIVKVDTKIPQWGGCLQIDRTEYVEVSGCISFDPANLNQPMRDEKNDQG